MTEEERQELLAEIAASKGKRADYFREYKADKRKNDPAYVAMERAAQKKYTAKNLDYLVSQNKTRYANNKRQAIEYKGGMCADCNGVFHHAVYDFHHLDNRDKDLPTAWLGRSWERIKEELDKCIMLCANCHRIRHHNKE